MKTSLSQDHAERPEIHKIRSLTHNSQFRKDAHKPPTHSVRLHEGGRMSMHHLTHPPTSLVRHPRHESVPLVIERDRGSAVQRGRPWSPLRHLGAHFPARFPPPHDTAMPRVLSTAALALALVAAPIRADDSTEPPCLEIDMSTMESALAAPCADPALACSNDDGCVCVRGVSTRLSDRFKD